MATQILTAREVVAFGTLGDNIPFAIINQHIVDAEMSLARKVLGFDFYQMLLSDVVQSDFEAKPWSKSSQYDQGDIVSTNGLTWVSKMDGNTTYPQEGDKWQLSKRFAISGYNEFYESQLRPYLVAAVSSRALPHLQPVGAIGLVDIDTDTGEKSSSIASQSIKQGAIKSVAQERLSNLFFYVLYQKERKASNLFDNSLVVRCPDKVKQELHAGKRRFYFRSSGASQIERANREIDLISQDIVDELGK